MILSIYLIGMILSFGMYVGAMHKLEKEEIENSEPTYETVHQDKFVYLVSLFSWVGLIFMLSVMIYNKHRPTLKYSYKELWDLYNSKQ